MRRKTIAAFAMPKGAERAGFEGPVVQIVLADIGDGLPLQFVHLSPEDAALLEEQLRAANEAFRVARILSLRMPGAGSATT